MTEQEPASRPELTVQLGDDHVATLEFSRPPNNYFSLGLITEIAGACEELAAGRDCRAIVLGSAGRVFCAGADFSGGSGGRPAGQHSGGSGGRPQGQHSGPQLTGSEGLHLYDAAARLFEQPLPIVAAVQGAAIGGGLGLAMAADFRVASPLARFAANFALLGIHQGFALTITLPAAIGQQSALDLLYTGRRVNGEEAVALGLADELAEPGKVRDQAHALAARIAASAPLAVRSIRETMRAPLVSQIRSALARERGEQERLMHTSDWREGLAAVRDRRAANFAGE
jgi:2-(1,2-epoxy-1,2-dihydrophenyl)acetyl-CoA isomerase